MAKKSARPTRSSKGKELRAPSFLLPGVLFAGMGLLLEPALIARIFGLAPVQALHHPSRIKLLWLFGGTALLLLRHLLIGDRGGPSPRRIPLDSAVATYVAATVLAALVAPSTSALHLAAVLALGATYCALRLVLRAPGTRGIRAWVIAGALTAAATFAIGLLAPSVWIKEIPWQGEISTLGAMEWAGPYGNPNHGASVALLSLFPAFVLWMDEGPSFRSRSLARAFLFLAPTAVLAVSLSRGAWLAALATTVLALLSRAFARNGGGKGETNSRPFGVGAAPLAALVAVALFSLPLAPLGKARALLSPGTLAKRAAYWKVARDAFLLRPLAGHGPGSMQAIWAARRPPDHRSRGLRPVARFAHSLPLQQAAETGLVGLAALGLLAGCLIHPLLASPRPSPGTTGLGWACLAFLIHNLGATTFHVPATAGTFVLGLALYGSALEEDLPHLRRGSTMEGRAAPFLLLLAMSAAFVATARNLETDALFHRAYLLRGHRKEQAEKALRDLLARDPSHVRARYDLAGLLVLRGRMQEAEALYAEVDRRIPGFDYVVANRCLVALQQGRWQDAQKLALRGLRRDVEDAGLWVGLARAQWNQGRRHEALAALDRALQIRPGDGELLRLRRAVAP